MVHRSIIGGIERAVARLRDGRRLPAQHRDDAVAHIRGLIEAHEPLLWTE